MMPHFDCDLKSEELKLKLNILSENCDSESKY